MANDGAVEIKITGSVDASVAASANEAKSAMAGLGDQASVSASTMAAALQLTGGNLKKLTPEIMAQAAAMTGAAASATENAAATGVNAAATEADTVATVANTGAHISSRAAYESLVLVHEALTGRFTRMAGSSMILTGALAGNAATAGFLGAVLSPLGALIAGVTAVTVGGAVAAKQYSDEQEKLVAESLGVGAAAGVTANQLRAAGAAAAEYSGQSVAASTASAQAFADAGVKSQEAITQLSGSVQTYAALTGEKAAEAQKQLAAAMQDPIKGAQELNSKLGILDSTQLEQIRTMTADGDKAGALAVILKALAERTDEARAAGVGANSTWQTMIASLSDMWGWLGRVNEELAQFNGLAGGAEGAIKDRVAQTARLAHIQTELNQASAAGAAIAASTPEGRDIAEREALIGKLAQLRQALIADTALHGANSDAARRDAEGIADYTHAVTTFLPAAEKAHQLAVIDDKLAVARHAHNKDLIADLTKQRELLSQAGEVVNPGDAAQKASDTAATAGDRASAGPKAKDTIVQQLQEELDAKKVAWDQEQDAQNTAQQYSLESEKAYWAQALQSTDLSTKDRLAIEQKYLAASKALRNEQIKGQLDVYKQEEDAAGKNADAKLAIVKEEVAYIGHLYGTESDQYKAVKDKEVQAERAASEQKLAIARQTQENVSKLAELGLQKEEADDKFLVDMGVKSHAQAIADEQNFENVRYRTESQGLQKRLALMLKDPTTDPAEFTKLTGQIDQAAQQHQNKLTAIEQQGVLQRTQIERQGIQQVASAFGNSLGQLLTFQKSFSASIKGLWQGIQQAIGQAIASIVEQWIAHQIEMLVFGKATNDSQVTGLVALAGAGGVASMAAAPWPMDMTAPAFGAAMATAAGAYSIGTSAAGGWDFVPRDGVATELHYGEMVLPNKIATPLRSMLTENGNGRAANDGGGGDTHHHWNINALDGESMDRWLRNNKGKLARAGTDAVRQGYSPARRLAGRDRF